VKQLPIESEKIFLNSCKLCLLRESDKKSALKGQITQFKNGQKLWTFVSFRETYRCSISTWKGIQPYCYQGSTNQTTMRYHFTPINMVKKKIHNNKC
jgi:hypothetical protein